MKWRAFSRMPQWVRLSEWLGHTGWALQKGHLCAVVENTIKPERCFDQCFVLESDPFIQLDCSNVVRSCFKCDSVDPLPQCVIQSCLDQRASYSLASIGGVNSHPQCSDMFQCICPMPKDIAPANNIAVLYCNVLCCISFDCAGDKFFNSFNRQRLNLREVAAFFSYRIKALAIAFRVSYLDLAYFDVHAAVFVMWGLTIDFGRQNCALTSEPVAVTSAAQPTTKPRGLLRTNELTVLAYSIILPAKAAPAID